MSSHRHRKRSHSHEKLHHSSTNKSPKRTKHIASEVENNNDEILRQILDSVTDLKAQMSTCNSRISILEANYKETASQGPQSRINDYEHADDSLSVCAGNDIDALESSQPRDTAIKPANLAIKPPELTNKSPEMTPASSELDIPSELQGKEIPETDFQQVGSEHDASRLYDPDNLALSWAPSEAFTAFLEKNFRRKLSYDQVCDILEQQSVPTVEALAAPTLDASVVHHIAQHNRKFVQERDKELQIVQRSFLNATGPLCTLHDLLVTRRSWRSDVYFFACTSW